MIATMNKKTISATQYFLCTFLCSIFITFGFFESVKYNSSLIMSAFYALLGALLLMSVCVPTYLVQKSTNLNTIKYISKINYPVSYIFRLFYMASYYIFTCVFLAKYVNFFKYQINREASLFVIILAFTAVVAFGSYKEINTLFRVNTILFVFSIVALIFVFLGLFDKLNFEYLNQSHSHNNLQITDNFKVLFLSFLPLTSFVVFSDKLKGNIKKGLINNGVFSYLLYFAITLFVFFVFGTFTDVLQYPVFVLSKLSNISVIKGGDGLMLALITVVTIIIMYLFTISSAKAIEVEKSKAFSMGYSLGVLIFTSLIVYIDPLYGFITNTLFLSMIAIIMLVLIPTFSYVIIKLKR